MIPLWLWGLILDGTGLLGSWFLARLHKTGWIVSCIAQMLWVIYSIQTRQWGFFPGIAIQTFVNIKGYLNWRKAEREQAAACEGSEEGEEAVSRVG